MDADQTEQLIFEVEKHPHLYNTSLKEYKDKILKDNSWRAVSESCGLTAEEAQRKGKNLRNSM